MFTSIKKNNSIENLLYSKILLLSRNKLFYTKFRLNDTFQNRINLIFLHSSFLFVKFKKNEKDHYYKEYYQKLFDIIFNKIELNMREIGYGDITVNKNMKFLVKVFYSILLNCENYNKKNLNNKRSFFIEFLEKNVDASERDYEVIVDYFDRYQAFCFDLSSDSVLKGNLKFNYL